MDLLMLGQEAMLPSFTSRMNLNLCERIRPLVQFNVPLVRPSSKHAVFGAAMTAIKQTNADVLIELPDWTCSVFDGQAANCPVNTVSVIVSKNK